MYEFEKDCAEKKRIASGARHKKNGSRSKYCGLPSDHLTQSQLKKLNGKVVSYKMREPMNWKEFSALPKDLQQQYLDELHQSFHVGMKQFAAMLGVHPATVHRLVSAAGLRTNFQHGYRMTEAERTAWAVFLGEDPRPGAPKPEPEAERLPEPEQVLEPAPQPEPEPRFGAVLENAVLRFDGPELCPEAVAAAIHALQDIPNLKVTGLKIFWNNRQGNEFVQPVVIP